MSILLRIFICVVTASFICAPQIAKAVTIDPLSDVCISDPAFTLTGGSPAGGIYSGPGVSAGVFDPKSAGTGTHSITYTVYNNGIPSSASAPINVYALPKPVISGNLVSCSDSISGTAAGGGFTPVTACSEVGGKIISVCINANEDYSIPSNPGSAFTWKISGGNIVSGQNTSSVTVQWTTLGSGFLRIIETNANGCVDSTGLCVKVVGLPTADFSANTVCLGISTQFTDLSVGAATWSWDFGDGSTSGLTNPAHEYSAGGTYNVKLVVRNACGCADSITKVVTVNSTPGPEIICPSTVCSGDSAPYSTDAICASYVWSVSGGTIMSGQGTSQILVNWGAGPTGTISLTTAGCTPVHCNSPTTVTIPILPSNPSISGPITVCQFANVNYSLPAWGGAVYNWSIIPPAAGTIQTGVGTNQIGVRWSNPADPNAKVVVSIGNPFIGCESTDTLDVSVLSSFIINGSTSVCRNSSETFTTSKPGSFSWTITGGTITSGQGTNSITVNWNVPAGSHTISATPITPPYCTAVATKVIIVVDPPPVDSITGQVFICPGSTYAYTAWSSLSGANFNWTVVNGILSSSTGNPVSVTWGATGPYSLSVTQGPTFPACVSPPLTFTVTDISISPPSISGSQTVCVDGTYSYSVPTISGATFTWTISPSNAGSIISGQGTNNIQIQYTGAANATLSLSISVCPAPIVVNLGVQVNPAPSPTIIASGDLCPGYSITLSSGAVFPAYEWKNSSLLVIGTGSSVIITAEGTYLLTVTDNNGCQGTAYKSINALAEPLSYITSPDPQLFCIDSVIDATLYGPVTSGTFQWYKDGIPVGTADSLDVNSIGTYSLVVTSPAGCTNSSIAWIIDTAACPNFRLPFQGPPAPTGLTDFVANGVNWMTPYGGDGSSNNAFKKGGNPSVQALQIFCTNVINFVDASGGAGSQWYWNFGDPGSGASNTSSLANPTHVFNDAGYYYVFFAVQFTDGTVGTISKSIEIPAVPDFYYNAKCGTVTFRDKSTRSQTSPITGWDWKFGDGGTSTSQNPTHTYAAGGVYNVTLSVSAGGCTLDLVRPITVPPFPTAQFSFPVVSCSGTPTPFTDLSSGSTIVFWDWDFGDGTNSQLQNPTHTYASGTFTVSLTVTDVNGCTSIQTQTLSVGAASGSGTITASGPTTFCASQMVTLTAPVATSYLWSNGSTQQSIVVNQSGTYSVVTYNASGCGASADPVTVIVNPLPNVTLTHGDTNLCSGNSFSASVLSKSGFSYQWYRNGAAMGGKTSASFSNNAAGTYYVVVTDNSTGCKDTSASVIVISVPTPNAPVITGPSSICYGNSAVFSANATGGTGNLSYSWTIGETGSSITISSAGTYVVFAIDENGCKKSASKSFTLNPLPDLSSFPTGCYTRCGDDTLYGPSGYASYEWFYNGGSSVGNSQNLVASNSGTYNLVVFTAAGCKDTSGNLDLTIAPLPVADAGIDSALCPGDSIQLNGSGADVYSWTPSGSLSSGTIANPFAFPGSATDYELTVTDINGCTDKDTVSIAIKNCNIPVVTSIGGAICSGTCLTVSAAGSSGTPPYTYSWSSGETGAGPHSLCPTVTTTYTITITDFAGLTGTDTLTIVVHPEMILTPSSQDVLCNAAGNGSGEVVVAGGTPTFLYLWTPGGATTDTTGRSLSPGTHTVVVTDANSCSKTATVTINEPPVLTAVPSATPANCGASDGTASVLAGGGTPAYTFNWSNGSTEVSISNLASGIYNVTVTDANNCSIVVSANVGNNSAPVIQSLTTTSVSCNGICDGTASASVTGDAVPFTYQWSSGGSALAEVSFLCVGVHSFTVTDNLGCMAVETFTVVGPSAVTVTVSPVDVKCNGDNTGTASVVANGGTGNYSYLWSDTQTGATASNLLAGLYSVTVTDGNGCTANGSANITEPSAIVITITTTSVSCYAGNNGTLNANVAGGVGPYSYVWVDNTGGTVSNVTGLPAGSYSLTVTDANSCTEIAYTTISQPSTVLSVGLTPSNISCFGDNDGSVIASLVGGLTPYTYSWSNTSTESSVSNLIAGVYSITVTDANGCVTSNTITLTEPPILTASISAYTDVSCNGFSDGNATVESGGGTPPYIYNWSVGQNSQTAGNLPAGVFTVTVTDSKGCIVQTTVTITQPPLITASITAQTNILCNGDNTGDATVLAGGGTPAYTYQWNNGQTNTIATGLSAISYSVTVTDTKGCTAQTTVTITEPPVLSMSLSPTDILCNGNSTGAVSASVNGGVGPYTYTWNDGSTTSSISNLAIGLYSATITDFNGCVVQSSVTLTEPSAITSTLSATPDHCSLGDGTAEVAASGGIPGYLYLWNNGLTSSSISNLNAGVYTLTLSDDNACIQTGTVVVNSMASDTLEVVNIVNTSCNGACDGSATLQVSGTGNGPYTYRWSTLPVQTSLMATSLCAGVYTCTLTDGVGCASTRQITLTEPSPVTATIIFKDSALCYGGNTGTATVAGGGGTPGYSYVWSTTQTGETASNLFAGIYNVTVSDVNGCTAQTAVSIGEPTPLVISITTTSVSCFAGTNGTINANTVGGTSPYTYLWLDGLGSTVSNVSSLTAGDYTLTVTDGNGCTEVETATITQPSIVLSLGLDPTDILCFGGNNGSITSSIVGGVPPFNYIWNTTATNSFVSNLTAGIYSLTITDNNGCVTSNTITLTQPPLLTTTITAQIDVGCNGGSDGSATVFADGGTPLYTYDWGSASGGQTQPAANNLSADTYTVTVTDGNGCVSQSTVTITQPPILTATITSQTDELCYGGNTGTAILLAGGGVPNYNYLWSNGQTGTFATALLATLYTVTVTDDNGCTAQTSVTITQPDLLTVNLTPTNILCNGATTGSVSSLVAGGTTPYNYNWSNSFSAPSITNVKAGNYSVIVTDAKGCTAQASTVLTEPPVLTLSLTSTPDHCTLGDGTASAMAGGGMPAYMFNWSNGQNTAVATGLSSGVHTALITDAYGCIFSGTVDVLPEAADTLEFVSSINANCNGDCNGTASLQMSGTGSKAPYQYAWSTNPQQNSLIATGLCAGIYTCSVTDVNGCPDIMGITITEPLLLTAAITPVSTLCYGESNGSASVTANGGTPSYAYNWDNGQLSNSATGLAAGVYSLTVTDNNGCSVVQGVQVNDAPQLIASISPSGVICEGEQATLNGSATGGTPSYNYQWNTGQNTAVITTTLAITTSFSFTVTDNNGCTSDAVVQVTVNPLPVVSFSSDTTDGCGPLCITFVNTTPASQGEIWDYGDGTSGSSLIHCYTAPGSYHVQLTVTDVNGCVSALEQSNYITVHPDPIADFTAQPQPTTILNPGIQYTDQSIGASLYTWSFGDNSGSDVQNPFHIFEDSGHYQTVLIVENSYGCKDTVEQTIIIEGDFSFFIPNAFTPNDDSRNNTFFPVMMGVERYEMWIYDRWGMLIWESSANEPQWDGKVQGSNVLVQEDVYVWLIKITDTFGYRHKYVGHVTVIR